jgi:hypothetical protein
MLSALASLKGGTSSASALWGSAQSYNRMVTKNAASVFLSIFPDADYPKASSAAIEIIDRKTIVGRRTFRTKGAIRRGNLISGRFL